MKRKELVRLVAARAIHSAGNLPPDKRAELYTGLALILDGAERELAQRTAFHLREAESHQSHFQQLIRGAA